MRKKMTLLLHASASVAIMMSWVVFLASCNKQNQAGSLATTIISFTPAGGSRGQFVKIDGTNFSTTAAENHVFFNDSPAIVSSATPNSLVVVVPEGAGSGKISVELNNKKISSGDNFNYGAAMSVLAGDGLFGFRDGQGRNAEFFTPFGGGLDGSGNIYIADQNNNRIRKITPGGLVTTLAGSGTRGFADGNALEAQFNSPVDAAADASGNVYVTDGNRIRKINAAGIVSTLAGDDAAAFADGSGADARFNAPAGIAVDASGNIYVADEGNNRIRKISPAGSVSTIAGNGVEGFRDGTATDAQFNIPFGIAIDVSGNIYIGDLGNNRIRKISPAGTVSTLAGIGSSGYKDGNPDIAEFGSTLGVSVDASGNVYVADGDNNVIRKITSSGTVSTLAGDGKVGTKEAPVSSAEFNDPSDILIGSNGTFYVTDNINNRVCKIL